MHAPGQDPFNLLLASFPSTRSVRQHGFTLRDVRPRLAILWPMHVLSWMYRPDVVSALQQAKHAVCVQAID